MLKAETHNQVSATLTIIKGKIMSKSMKEIINLCIDKNVDFEVFHGVNTRQTVRAAMLIELGETIRVDFGDKEHGQRFSRAHVSNNHKLTVTIDELVTAIYLQQNENRWAVQNEKATKNNMVRIPPSAQNGSSSLSISGSVIEVKEPMTVESQVYNVYVVEQKNFYRTLTENPEMYEGEPTRAIVLTKSTKHAVGDKVYFVDGKFKPGIGIVFNS
jgi:hypothetical protein